MLLGSDYGFASLPFASITNQNSVTVTVTKNELTISIGNPGIIADAIVEIPNPNALVLGFGDLTITGDSNVTGVKNELALGTGTVTVTADANVTAVKNELVISSGTVTITADANVSPTGSGLTLATGTAQAITWSEIIPGATMVWTPIEPY